MGFAITICYLERVCSSNGFLAHGSTEEGSLLRTSCPHWSLRFILLLRPRSLSGYKWSITRARVPLDAPNNLPGIPGDPNTISIWNTSSTIGLPSSGSSSVNATIELDGSNWGPVTLTVEPQSGYVPSWW